MCVWLSPALLKVVLGLPVTRAESAPISFPPCDGGRCSGPRQTGKKKIQKFKWIKTAENNTGLRSPARIFLIGHIAQEKKKAKKKLKAKTKFFFGKITVAGSGPCNRCVSALRI